ncbi:MAG: hypothetical protein FJZ01_04950 [Candidatus Sericytochromatia bacterium]|nr:hypothetical protein [Candidatus Tanganyikabacteria bacterium]
MTRGTLMVEPKLVVLSPEVLAKVGFDSPPASEAAPEPRTKARRKQEARALRDIRRHMHYHWF